MERAGYEVVFFGFSQGAIVPRGVHGLKIVRTYSDQGKSGLSIGGRASLKKLIADVEAGGGTEIEPEIEATGHETHLDMVRAEPTDAEDVSLPDGIAPDHGTAPVKAAE